jgi:hypothetical protein
MYKPTKLSGADKSSPKDEDYIFFWGLQWEEQLISDSGSDKDLDGMETSEVINDVPGADGAAKFLGANTFIGTWFPYSSAEPPIDRTGQVRSASKKLLIDNARLFADFTVRKTIDDKGKGASDLLQYFVFIDKRTGYTDKNKPLVVQASGFRIHYVYEKSGGKYWIRVKRTAEANNGADKGHVAAADTEEVADEFQQ